MAAKYVSPRLAREKSREGLCLGSLIARGGRRHRHRAIQHDVALDRHLVDPSHLPRQTMGEVSRLAVVGQFRQRKGESETPASMNDSDFGGSGPRTRFPFIPVSLYLGAAAIALRCGVEHVFVLTEPRLASHFVRIGFDIRAVGRTIEHRGERVPSLLSSSKVVAGLRPLIRPMYQVIEQAVDAAFLAHPRASKLLPKPILQP